MIKERSHSTLIQFLTTYRTHQSLIAIYTQSKWPLTFLFFQALLFFLLPSLTQNPSLFSPSHRHWFTSKRFWINPVIVATSKIRNVCSGLKPWISIALFLIRERSREDSLRKHYFKILPEVTDSTIYWWVTFNFGLILVESEIV